MTVKSRSKAARKQNPARRHPLRVTQDNPSANNRALEMEGAQRAGRGLIGWLPEEEAVSLLLGRIPAPDQEVAQLRITASECRAAVAARPVFSPTSPFLPYDGTDLAAVAQRSELQAALAGLNWRPALVDLRNVLSFQKAISVEGLDARLSAAADGMTSLLEICLPVEQPVPPSAVIPDQDGMGFTVSSPNPNLRIGGSQANAVDVVRVAGLPPMRMLALTLLVNMGASYLQVVEYNGRYFVRDGYHRAAGLIKRGMFIVPCIHVIAESFEQVGVLPGMLTHETMFGDHPPLVTDFWCDSVARDVLQPASRRAVRVRGEQFAVPI